MHGFEILVFLAGIWLLYQNENHTSDIRDLKRRVAELERDLASLRRTVNQVASDSRETKALLRPLIEDPEDTW